MQDAHKLLLADQPFHFAFFGPPIGVPINAGAPRSLTPTTRSHFPSRLQIGNLFTNSQRSPRHSRKSPGRDRVARSFTSCGFAFTAVANSFWVILFPSAFFLSIRACASALPTLLTTRDSVLEKIGLHDSQEETYDTSIFSGGLGASSRSSLAIR